MTYQPPFEITPAVLNLVSLISEKIGELKQNFQSLSPQLRKANKIKTITGTLQIEGSTLTEAQVSAVLEGKRVLGTVRELAEVHGAIKAYDQLSSLNPYSLDDLLTAHRDLMGEILTHAGQFRSKPVGIHQGDKVIHVAPPAHRVSGLMADLFQWLQQSEHHPLITSSVFHYEFEFIHPFIDGNGRMGRLWQTLILSKWKPLFQAVPIESIIRDHQQDYYKALQQAGSEGESTAFLLFMLAVILEAIEKVSVENDQVSDQVEKLISVISNNWVSSAKMMKALHLSHKPTFRKNYLKPALEHGLIIMKHPDSPRSPKQHYKRASK